MRLTLDPELLAGLAGQPTPQMANPAAARANAAALITEVTLPAGVELSVHDAPAVRVLAVANPRGIVLDIHGGGFVSGFAQLNDAANARLAAELNVTVVSVEYRRAPEHRYPAALDDCVAALDFARSLNPTLPLVAYGDSAGGNLAAALALRCPEQLAAVVLIEPVLDARLDTESLRLATDTAVWDAPNARLSWEHYLGGQAPDAYASPALAADLSDYPPTFLLANQADPLLDEDWEFARRLALADVDVEAHLLPRACHGVLGFAGTAIAERARGWVIDFLNRHLAGAAER